VLTINVLEPLPPLRGLVAAVRAVAYPLAGVRSRGVFSQKLFLDYGYQLTFAADGCRDETLHAYTVQGLLAPENRDRVWELWWKQTQAPWTSRAEAETRLARWVAYWAPRSGCGPGVAPALRARRLYFSARAWRARVLACNLSVPWIEVARLRPLASGGWGVEWAPTRAPNGAAPDQRLGTFLSEGYLQGHHEARHCVGQDPDP
jgi:hypothetical protein